MLKNERYIGTYIYKDIIRDEDVIPAIIEKDVFYKVQEMLKVNKRAPAHQWVGADYILTGKLFCGKCGSQMAGVSGTSKTGEKYHYYACMKRWADKSCDKKNIRQDLIESLITKTVYELLDDQELLEFIADKTWTYYLEEDSDKAEIDALNAEIIDVDKRISNLMKSLEDRIVSSAIQERMVELEDRKRELKAALAEREIAAKPKLTKEMILFFLEKFRDMDRDDPKCRKRMIDTFINSIFLYEETLTIAFNYSGDDNMITLNDIKNRLYPPR